MRFALFIIIILSWGVQGLLSLVPQDFLFAASFLNGVVFGSVIAILWWRY